MNEYEIRRVELKGLEALDGTFRSGFERTHADNLQDQQAGIKSFFVAWAQEVPVGHVLVNWHDPRQAEPFAAFPDCPEINRLAVIEAFQRRGIATNLIAACEAEAADKGLLQIGLGTNPVIPEDLNLYRRLGYQDSGVGIFDDVYRVLDENGNVITIRDDTRFLVKDIGDTK